MARQLACVLAVAIAGACVVPGAARATPGSAAAAAEAIPKLVGDALARLGSAHAPADVAPVRRSYGRDPAAWSEAGLSRRLMIAWWLRPELPAAQRRAALFALWDAAGETTVADEARAQIESYIRRNLCCGADAFTDEEIARYNRQRGGRPPAFDPYGDAARFSTRSR